MAAAARDGGPDGTAEADAASAGALEWGLLSFKPKPGMRAKKKNAQTRAQKRCKKNRKKKRAAR